MPNKQSPVTEKILEVISDGEWHDFKEVRDKAAKLVPPGTAFRKAESNRVRHYIESGRPVEERKYGGKDDTILSGQRAFANAALTGLRRRGRIEIEYGSQPKRKRPERVRLLVK